MADRGHSKETYIDKVLRRKSEKVWKVGIYNVEFFKWLSFKTIVDYIKFKQFALTYSFV